jgi:hypothetical protein
MNTRSLYKIIPFPSDKYMEIYVKLFGARAEAALRQALETIRGGNYTANVFINMRDSGCAFLCRLLEEAGFFFTGIQPLSGQAEYLILHYSPAQVEVPFASLALDASFGSKLKIIEEFYNARKAK